MAHWRVRVCERPVVSCTRTFWNVAIVERAGLATREFRPVFWLTSRHAQTVIAHVLADLSFLLLRPVRWRRQAVRTFDGGEVWLDWLVAHRDEFALHGDGLFATLLLTTLWMLWTVGLWAACIAVLLGRRPPPRATVNEP